jgi:hypothetical protein
VSKIQLHHTELDVCTRASSQVHRLLIVSVLDTVEEEREGWNGIKRDFDIRWVLKRFL